MDVLQTGLDGLRAAEAQLNRAAERIAKAGATDESTPPVDVADLSAAAVAMMAARNHFEASSKVIETANEVQQSTINLLG